MDLLDLGELIRDTRKARKMTQVELSQASGVSRLRIVKLERGEVFDMSYQNVTKLLSALDLDLRVGTANAGRPTFEELQERKDDLYDTPRLGE